MAKEYNIRKTDGSCSTCEQKLEPGTEIMALVREGNEDLIREDYCCLCWKKAPKTENKEILCIWRTRIPKPVEKKKLLVDDNLLKNLFQRLAETDDESRIKFRYVLGLILMRKRILIYDRSETDGQGREVWLMRMRGQDGQQKVIDPKLDEDQISEVSKNLSEIMEGDF